MVKIYTQAGNRREFLATAESLAEAKIFIVEDLERNKQDTHYFRYVERNKEIWVDYGSWYSFFVLVEE